MTDPIKPVTDPVKVPAIKDDRPTIKEQGPLYPAIDPKIAAEKKDILNKIETILASFSGMESNIPTNHEYWQLVNRYRGL